MSTFVSRRFMCLALALSVSSSAALAIPAASVELVIQGNQLWQASGLVLETGDLVTATASGCISVSNGDPGWTPDGCRCPYIDGDPCTSVPAWSGSLAPDLGNRYELVGRIGTSGVPFIIGSSFLGYAFQSGELYLACNDEPNAFSDNSGSWLVQIESTPVMTSICPASQLRQFIGVASGDRFGEAVANAGDVDNDGYDDIIIGALHATAGGFEWAGSVYVYSGLNRNLLWQFEGIAESDVFGHAVSGAGDVDNDGYADLLVGAYLTDPGGRIDAGSAYVYSGQTGALLWQFDGIAAGDKFGHGVAGAGDVNNDGYDDVVVGAHNADPSGRSEAGSAYVFSGMDGSLLWQFDGVASGDNLGAYVGRAGDVNNDGFDDLVVGAVGADPSGLGDAGSAYVYSGMDGSLVWQFDGTGAGDNFGSAVACAGDANNDGFDDIIVGASGADPGGRIEAGSAYVYSGATGTLLWQFDGIEEDDHLGYQSAAGIGDVDVDGYDDVVVGAFLANPLGRQDAGAAYVFSGQTGGLLWEFDGVEPGDYLGESVASAGDLDLDGKNEVLVGAAYADPGGQSEAGMANIYGCCLCPHQSDLNADSFVDAVDLAIEIDIVFFGFLDTQDPRCTTTRADFNDDGVADAVDLAFLIDHVFFGGVGPVDPCSQ